MRIELRALRCVVLALAAVLVGLAASSSVHAAWTSYRAAFTAVIDRGWFMSDPSKDPDCAAVTQLPTSSGIPFNCAWTEIVGKTASGFWEFSIDEFGNNDCCNGLNVTLPFPYGSSFPYAGGQSFGSMMGLWTPGATANDFGDHRLITQVVVDPRDLPDLSTSLFYFEIWRDPYSELGWCPKDLTEPSLPPPTGLPPLDVSGPCRGEGHLTSLTIRQMNLAVDEPGTAPLAAMALFGAVWALRRPLTRRLRDRRSVKG